MCDFAIEIIAKSVNVRICRLVVKQSIVREATQFISAVLLPAPKFTTANLDTALDLCTNTSICFGDPKSSYFALKVCMRMYCPVWSPVHASFSTVGLNLDISNAVCQEEKNWCFRWMKLQSRYSTYIVNEYIVNIRTVVVQYRQHSSEYRGS